MESNEMSNQEKSLTLVEKLKFFFIKPQKLFEQFIEKPKYLINLIIIAIISSITSVVSSKVSKKIVQETMDQQIQGIDPSAAQMAKGITDIMTSPVVVIITGIISLLILIYLSSAIYFALAKMFGGNGTYKQMVSTYVLAYYPVAVGNLISAISKLNTNSITANVTIGDALIKAFNIFGLWRMVLLAIGISVVFKLSRKKAAIIVIIIWAVLLIFSLISVGFTQTMQNMAP